MPLPAHRIPPSAITVAGLLLSACSSPAPHSAKAATEATQRVTAVRAERTGLSRVVELTAEFRPYQEVEVHSKVAGYLKKITVDVGDRVNSGQLLGIIEVPEYTQELQQASAVHRRTELDVVRAQSQVAQSQSASAIAKITYDRLVRVSEARPHLIAQQEIDTATARYREAEAALATAKANVAAVEQQVQVSDASRARVATMMSYLRVTAPFSGMVTRRYADTGAMIQAGTASQTQAMPLVRISQVDRLRLTLPVPESTVSRIRLKGPVEVRVDSLQRVVQGKVSRFTGRLDSATRTMEAEVDIPNPDGSLMPGMYGSASLVLDRNPNALAVPVQAVSGIGAKPSVLVIGKDGRLQHRAVTLGIETPNLVEIKSGVNEHELVAIGNRSLLKPGAQVQSRLVTAIELAGGH
ncbi:MAG: efflux RND transporter periplasmic adaptor subunit [Bryobacteraceae bacterium]|nr:efflux RND transporter periplasmic adaptor subunit [Bryobacteraceae bacterium]